VVISIEQVVKENNKTALTKSISDRLKVTYNLHNNFAAIDSYATSKVILNIIKMHQNIQDSSEILRDAAKFAAKNCDSQ
jgi:hypothetical protein